MPPHSATASFTLLLLLALGVQPIFGAADAASNSHADGGTPTLTGETGRRAGSNEHSQAATARGPLLLQDVYTLEKLRRFNHERIAERVVHARGAGAHGVFRATRPLAHLTAARLFEPGTRTEVFVRFSTVIHGRGSPETLRDPRGFAVKFKTDDGNWDLVGNNLPVFFIRDHIKFPDMVHALKPHPVTNAQDPNRFFDFFAALGGQATHMLTHLYSDAGIPASYRFMNGHSVHAFKFVNATRHVTYVKFKWISAQGVRNLSLADAARTQATDFSHATADLYAAIRRGELPEWELAIQTLAPGRLHDFDFDPLDATKDWPEHLFPLTVVGRLTLTRVPDNFFLFSEQSAFDPGNFLPAAIEPSEDRLLQGRLLSYHESQTHRLGSNNFHQLPVNRPATPVRTYNQEGVMAYSHAWNGSVNYEPSTQRGTYAADATYLYSSAALCGATVQTPITKTANFAQAGDTFRRFSARDREALVENMAADLTKVRSRVVRHMVCAHLFKADERYGAAVAAAARCDMRDVRRRAAELRN
eukprot:gb/GEZJ01001587.1/.p1 GENE.gb/GEZJ01001587.1/~~gb/GEZJ01001587.1/.p1  ORF type:complete len:531 (+),score=57.33 gb/GEZJ01001587.1/:480-2072(+)